MPNSMNPTTKKCLDTVDMFEDGDNHHTSNEQGQDTNLAPKPKPIFSYQHAYTKEIFDIYSIDQFDIDVLRQNQSKGGIRTVSTDVDYKGKDLEGDYAIPMWDLNENIITGYYIVSKRKSHAPIVVGGGITAIHLDNKNPSCFIATDNFTLFLRLSQLNYVAIYHLDIYTAFDLVNSYLDTNKPRIIATDKSLESDNDLKIHFDADVSKLTEREIKGRLNNAISNIKPVESQPLPQSKESKPISEEWGEIIPLTQSANIATIPYPIESLPPIARQAVIAIAEYVQAPISMAAQCVIGAMSHISQPHINAPDPIKQKGQPCSLYLLTEGQSGSRKSSCMEFADKSIRDKEEMECCKYQHDIELWEADKQSFSGKELKEFLENYPKPIDPSCVFSEGTVEFLTVKFIDGALKNASISNDEAAQFFSGHTMKSDTRNHALGTYTKIFDNGFVERSRSKSNLNGSGRAYNMRLTFNLQGQHEILADAIKDPILRGQGFLPRFILTVPENLAGSRLQDEAFRAKNSHLDARLVAYWHRCENLLDDCPMVRLDDQQNPNQRAVMKMDADARGVDLAFYNETESLQRQGQSFEYLQPFASRASQLARRLATVFAFFQGEPEITGITMQGACNIIRHSLGEWLRYADVEPKKESDAERLLNWLVKKCIEQKVNQINYSFIQTSCPRPMQKNGKLLEMVIQQLDDSNYIKIETISKKRLVVLNPILLKK